MASPASVGSIHVIHQLRPRTIFGAIVIWLLATVVLSSLGFVVTSFLISARGSQPDGFMRRFQQFELNEARVALKEGGPERLAAYLGRIDSMLGARHWLIDPEGRSLVDGSDRSEMLRRRGRPGWFSFGTGPPPTMVIRSGDGLYRMLIEAPPPPIPPMDLLRNFVWLPLLMAGLCYLLAIHLASPLRKLTRAVERFGGGDLSARVGLGHSRRDEIGELSRAFDAMAERTQTLLTAERRLLQDVSHELRSPLARLGFGVELARTSPDRNEALDRVKRDLARLNALVDELLQLTRSEGDPTQRAIRQVDLVQILRDLVEDCSVEAEAKGCGLEQQTLCDPGGVIVLGEPELIRRAIENVVRNAIRHAAAGTAIHVMLTRADSRFVIEVRDRGPGVPDEDLERIFQPFYRVEGHRDRTSGGVGLGLAIARRAMTLHGGEIRASNASPGLLVRMEFPASGV